MLFSLYKKPYEIKFVMQLFILCILCVVVCVRPLPRDSNALDIDRQARSKENLLANRRNKVATYNAN